MVTTSREARHAWKLGALGALIVLAALALGSCNIFGSLLGVSIDQRISNFNSQVATGDYADLYTNFSSSQTQQYSQMKNATYWDSTPFAAADTPQAITLTNTTDPTNVTGSFSNAGGTFNVTMTFAQSGSDWYIVTLTLTPVGGSTTSFEIKKLY